jgi:hypothetical protein
VRIDPVRHLRWDPLAAAMRDLHWSLDAIEAAIERAGILQELGLDPDAACAAALAEVGAWPEGRRRHQVPITTAEAA